MKLYGKELVEGPAACDECRESSVRQLPGHCGCWDSPELGELVATELTQAGWRGWYQPIVIVE